MCHKNKTSLGAGIRGIYNTDTHLTLSRCEVARDPASDKFLDTLGRTSHYNKEHQKRGCLPKWFVDEGNAGKPCTQSELSALLDSSFKSIQPSQWAWWLRRMGVGWLQSTVPRNGIEWIENRKVCTIVFGSVWVTPSLTSRLPWWVESSSLTSTTTILLLVTRDALSIVLIKGAPGYHQDAEICSVHPNLTANTNPYIHLIISFSTSIPNRVRKLYHHHFALHSYRSGHQKSALMKFLLVCLLTLGLLPMEMFAKGNNQKTTNTTQTTPANNEYSKTVACTSIWTYLLYDDGTFDNSYLSALEP